ncbi:MAG: membrane protein insertase YidC [Bacteroidales bacterium]
MNRDNIIGLILIFVILIGFSIWNAPSEEEKEQMRRAQDSIRALREAEQELIREKQALEKETTNEEELVLDDQEVPDSVKTALLKDRLGLFAGAATGEDQIITIENDLMIIKVSRKGGHPYSVELKNYKTWDQQPLMLFYGDRNEFDLQFYSQNRLVSTQNLYFTPDTRANQSNGTYKVSGEDSLTFSMRLYPDNHTQGLPKYLEYKYTIRGNEYMVDFDINTVGMYDVIASNTSFFNLTWNKDVPRLEKSRKNEMNNTTVYYKFLNDEVDRLRETRDGTEKLSAGIKWIAYKQQFFTSVLIAGESFNNAVVSTESFDESNEDFLKRMESNIDIAFTGGADNNIPLSFYFGPNHFNTLKAHNLSLESQIPLGWALFGWINRYIVIKVFNYLDSFNLNYGIIILILTLMLKLVLFPIAYKTYLSSARMRVLKPEIEELGKKFPKKEDAMKKQQATMSLYRKAGVNPMAGCVPMLLQFPILIAMFRFFPASIELRQEGFLWADDLSSYDSILQLPFEIPWYGDHVSLFTLLMTVSTILYTKMNSQMMSTGTQMPGMKTMLYMMPVMLLFVFNSYASGLSYYYFLANIITFIQMYAFRFMIDEDKIRHKIEHNKKKPVKKSSWMKRLEDMQKQQQQKARTRK